MAAKKYISKQDRALYIRFEARKVCRGCGKGDQCAESTHQKKVVERWICEICSKEHNSKAGVIRHMQEEHERKRKTHTKSGPRVLCECGEEFSTMHQYYDHHNSVHVEPRSESGRKRRQTKEGQEPDLKRVKKRVEPEKKFEDLLAKIKAQLQSKD